MALSGQFWLSLIFFASPPPLIRLRPRRGPMGTENFESPPHQKFREKNPAGCIKRGKQFEK